MRYIYSSLGKGRGEGCVWRAETWLWPQEVPFYSGIKVDLETTDQSDAVSNTFVLCVHVFKKIVSRN